MLAIDALVPRRAYGTVVTALADTRVVVINGARQTGNSSSLPLDSGAVELDPAEAYDIAEHDERWTLFQVAPDEPAHL